MRRITFAIYVSCDTEETDDRDAALKVMGDINDAVYADGNGPSLHGDPWAIESEEILDDEEETEEEEP